MQIKTKKNVSYLGPWSACIEKGWSSMSEPMLRHQMVCFQSRISVIFVNTNRNPHQHVLWPFYNSTVHLQKVRPLKGFEAKIIKVKISVVDDRTIQACSILEPIKRNGSKVTYHIIQLRLTSNLAVGLELEFCFITKIRAWCNSS